MKIGDIKNRKIAKKYAQALYDSANEQNIAKEINSDLAFFCETINTNKQLSEIVYSPIINNNDKKSIIEKLFESRINKLFLDFLFLLIEANRTIVINEILNQYSVIYNQENNIIKPIIISAIELDENQKSRIIKKLETKLTKTINPEYQINPDIIGGLVIEIEDKTIDCSLKTKFENMKKQLTKGNKYGNN